MLIQGRLPNIHNQLMKNQKQHKKILKKIMEKKE